MILRTKHWFELSWCVGRLQVVLVATMAFVQGLLHEDGLSVQRIQAASIDPSKGPIGEKHPCLDVIMPERGENVKDPLPQIVLQDGEKQFDPPIEVPGHQVGTGQVQLRVAGVSERVDPAVFQEAADDGVHFNVFTELGNANV